MSRNTTCLFPSIALALLCAFTLVGFHAHAQDQSQIEAKDDPIFRDYKGVILGMTAEECRHKLGSPQDKGDTQDYYSFSDNETAQINYNAQHQVMAIAIIYIGADKAPLPKTVIGSDLTAKADGSMYRLVRYPKAQYWVSYSRTSGDSPLVTVMMQRYKP